MRKKRLEVRPPMSSKDLNLAIQQAKLDYSSLIQNKKNGNSGVDGLGRDGHRNLEHVDQSSTTIARLDQSACVAL